VGTNGCPVVVPVEVKGGDEAGIVLEAPDGVVPGGGRRAGLTAHAFSPKEIGQEQRIHTGWMEPEADGRRVLYAPHTETGYRMPASKLLYRIAAGFATRRGVRGAREAGFTVG